MKEKVYICKICGKVINVDDVMPYGTDDFICYDCFVEEDYLDIED